MRAFFHCSRGLSARKKSDSSMPIGSVAISALPRRVQMLAISSGNSASSSFSMRSFTRHGLLDRNARQAHRGADDGALAQLGQELAAHARGEKCRAGQQRQRRPAG